MQEKNANYWIENLNLKPHPEGGFYREIFASGTLLNGNCLPQKISGNRPFYTSIYFLLKNDDISHFHRIKSDEIWCFHAGDALNIHIIDKNGNYLIKKLGLNTDENEFPQHLVEAGCWFGAGLKNQKGYALVGCLVSPGFDFQDFELAKKTELLVEYPEHKEIIEKLSC